MSATRSLLGQLLSDWENERELLDPQQYRRRMEVLDRLDANFPADARDAGDELRRRGLELVDKLQAANTRLADLIRFEIREGRCPETFLEFLGPNAGNESVLPGLSYDYLDDLLSDVFRFEPPEAEPLAPGPEAVFYQPTPARHIFELIRGAGISSRDVLIDFGSGLGHVPLLVSICTGAEAIGVDIDPAWVGAARKCAESLRLRKVTFVAGDARQADLSIGTVFYLYTPFTGSVLQAVVESLRREALKRPIRICTLGPCTRAIAEQAWLNALGTPDPERVTVFIPCE